MPASRPGTVEMCIRDRINVHKRIQIRFGKKYGLEIESEPDEGTMVRIRLPYIEYSPEILEYLDGKRTNRPEEGTADEKLSLIHISPVCRTDRRSVRWQYLPVETCVCRAMHAPESGWIRWKNWFPSMLVGMHRQKRTKNNA